MFGLCGSFEFEVVSFLRGNIGLQPRFSIIMIFLFALVVASRAAVNYTSANASFSWPSYNHLIQNLANSTLQNYPALPYQII